MWITNGTVDGKTTGDIFLVYAKTGKGRSASDLTSFLVEKGTPGFSVGQKIMDKCGMRASMTAELVFDNVKVGVKPIPFILHRCNPDCMYGSRDRCLWKTLSANLVVPVCA
jgi:hypothetical protein